MLSWTLNPTILYRTCSRSCFLCPCSCLHDRSRFFCWAACLMFVSLSQVTHAAALQCRKLGLLSPERQLAAKCRTVYQQMWANNGDTLSRQYAGTAALKVRSFCSAILLWYCVFIGVYSFVIIYNVLTWWEYLYCAGWLHEDRRDKIFWNDERWCQLSKQVVSFSVLHMVLSLQ